MFVLDYLEIIGRLLVAVLFGGIIGYEREIKGHNAGLRTHILVCVGAALFSLVQIQATYTTIELAMGNPDLLQILNTDVTRLPAQIVSGIGFLGAGTIIVTKRSVTGLTTAASIWATASLGIAAGMGYYFIAFSGCIIILLILLAIRKVFRVQDYKTLEVSYYNREETKKTIQNYFDEHSIIVIDLDYLVDSFKEDEAVFLVIYTLSIPDKFSSIRVIEDLSDLSSVIGIRTIKDV
ncbi:putative Mg2+ transporter-C (MgtC) family protein [Carnobacterium iners]|uniref:Putative Mg2+ transporter-C (MgtC) family protein n=1 Tax=Carnobacterium iners TaxID=1073423 RepID=A0A1X7N3T7_9LACT|nr:MgtC/SapB family protein [Carnobacterium iners]SEK61667.1 putative Mg2+ transporter-C (MgtC) family protein [Carnobacterium iners]SMH32023.1 putative Mg2+ transporter-C (MgtC) family protein [Carnobacterium iners]